MGDDMTGNFRKTSRHVSVWIEAAAEAVYEFAADPHNMSQWASGLAEGGLRQTADGWVAASPMGEVTVEFAPPNEFGVLDHPQRVVHRLAGRQPHHVVQHAELDGRGELDRHLAHR